MKSTSTRKASALALVSMFALVLSTEGRASSCFSGENGFPAGDETDCSAQFKVEQLAQFKTRGCLIQEEYLDKAIPDVQANKAVHAATEFVRARCAEAFAGRQPTGDACRNDYTPSEPGWLSGARAGYAARTGSDPNRLPKNTFVPSSQEWEHACVAYYNDRVIPLWHAKFTAAQKARLAEEERRKEAHFAEAKRRQAAEERQRVAKAKLGEQARIGRIQSLNIPKSELVVWAGPSGTGEFKGTNGDTRVFEHVNTRFQGELERRQRLFSVPAKRELEATSEFQERVAAYRAKYDAMTSGSAVLEEYIGREFGNPMIGAVDYDADSGRFTLHVSAERANYRLKTEYAVSRDKATGVKEKLRHGAPHVIYSFTNNRLVLRDVFLVSDGEILPLRPVDGTEISVQFTKESAAAFRNRLAQEKAQEEREAKRQAEERAKQAEERAKQAEERARYEATRPKSSNERRAEALARSPNTLCSTLGHIALNLGPDTVDAELRLDMAARKGCYQQ